MLLDLQGIPEAESGACIFCNLLFCSGTQDVHLRALTGVDHNTELAHKAERRLATLYAQADQQGPAQSACPMPPEAQRAFGHLLGAPAAAPARLQATVLLADIVERTG